ncbi:DUF1758 domain-containing protein [Trichonephila clavata]|uniref:DUF1758 domain-containing protein n=2 Tax=Trichonephila clavata TaxID=2740835 RepID=A0A8X6KCB3_TRICU|nr:DUF1758 domain-containing protein [Trichonephila clavata]
MAPRELSELTVLSRRKSHLLGQITRIKNCLENVDSPLNQAGLKNKLASLYEIKGKIDALRTESYNVLSDEEFPNFESSLDKMEEDADNLESSSGVIHDQSVANSPLEPCTPTTVCLYNEVGERSVLLSMAKVEVHSPAWVCVSMIAILDSGSQQNVCSFQAANVLGLKKQYFCATIAGVSGSCFSVRKRVSTEISNGGSFKRKLNFLLVPEITGCVPTQPFDLTKMNLPQNITYADAEFNIPKRIDILLGGEIFYELLKSKQIKLQDNSIILQDSVFGYIVTGFIQNDQSNYYFCNFIQDQVDKDLTKFWDLEPIGIKEESNCEPDDQAIQHFKSSVRFKSGRYEVGFPGKEINKS